MSNILDAIWNDDLEPFHDLYYLDLNDQDPDDEPEQEEGEHIEMFDSDNDVVFLDDVEGIEEIPDREMSF